MNYSNLLKKRIFLDATAQIYRLSGNEECEKKVIGVLQYLLHNLNSEEISKKFITSSIIYAKFLNTFVIDIIGVRDLIKKKFLDKKKFELNIIELKEQIVYEFLGSKRSNNKNVVKRLTIILEAIKMKYFNMSPIKTESVIRFLDTNARDLMFRDFFYIRMDGFDIKIEKERGNYLNEIGCVVNEPLQTECQKETNNKCRIDIHDNIEQKRLHDKCLSSESPITKCQKEKDKKKDNICKVDDFLKKPKFEQKFEMLLEEVKKEMPFSTIFRNNNKIWITSMRNFPGNWTEYRGDNCLNYFLDMMVALQCPEDAIILSNNKNFKEFGKVINRPDDLFLNFSDFRTN